MSASSVELCCLRGAMRLSRRKATVFSSGATMPARAPASIDMLQSVIRPFHFECANGVTGELDRRSRSRRRSRRARSLRASGLWRRRREVQFAVDRRRACSFGLRCSRHCVASTCADFGGADAERQRAEGAVRSRVAIAAHDDHAGLR